MLVIILILVLLCVGYAYSRWHGSVAGRRGALSVETLGFEKRAEIIKKASDRLGDGCSCGEDRFIYPFHFDGCPEDRWPAKKQIS